MGEYKLISKSDLAKNAGVDVDDIYLTNTNEDCFNIFELCQELHYPQHVTQCVKCGSLLPIDLCSNCHYGFMFDFAPIIGHGMGIYCVNCDMGMARWDCPVCNCDNPYKIYILSCMSKKRSGCFIATAACGNTQAREVMILSEYRDSVLRKTKMGRTLIGAYYVFSPPIANFIAKNKRMRNFVFHNVVYPISGIAERSMRNILIRTIDN
jgi:hypothetical protein